MGKINNYVTNSSPTGSDKVIGTTVSPSGETENFTLSSIAGLATLQSVLDADNSATENINLTGNMSVTGAYLDSSGDAGTAGQVLSSTVTGTNWIDQEPGTEGTLQETLDNGNTSTTPFNITTGTSYSEIDNLRTKSTGALIVEGLLIDSAGITANENNLLGSDNTGKPIWITLRVDVPISATSTGIKGQYAVDSSFFYVCVSTDTWRRVAVSAW